ncbi:hypothetical protein [Streptomyces sp. NPDC056683]|uniref:hypothetical protein n=1 Tax=Streptomyces sp. NPDC056683 TaxID=3345910 RepID=UPI0036BF50ED
MAAPKAAGTADGSTQHTPKHLDAAASGYTLDLTPGQLEGLARLREPFPESAIAKRPQVWCGGCRNNRQDKVCSAHTKTTCKECGEYVTTAHKHLDYVGHAEATNRLLSVDPTWDWEPMAKDDKGRPLIDDSGGMWITLTVCGMTRKGYGDAVGKPATTTATKEIIGDAIRNAAMRFGMALDLWSPKTDLHAEPPHPAEPFLDAIRQEHVWMSTEYLTGLRRAVDEAGQLDFVMPNGGGKTLGDVIDGQLAVLADAAQRYAEMRLKRDEEREAERAAREAERAAREAERAAAAAQVAAEHGVPAQQPPAGPPPVDNGPKTAADIRTECGPIWLDPVALQNLLDRAIKIGAVNAPADPHKPRGVTLGGAMRTQIEALLRAQPRTATTAQASEAAHQYAEHESWGDTGDVAG